MLFFIFDDDIRYKYLEQYLLQKNLVKTNNISDASIVILPFIINNKFNFENFFNQKMKKGVKFYVGVKNDELDKVCKDREIELHEMMSNKSVTVLNSVATAEGTLKYIIENNNKTVFESSFLIMGYGFCGERIAKNLISLGAKVEVFDRNDFKMKKANLIGCSNVDIVKHLNYDVVINTIPKRVIQNNILNNKAIIIDISSKPFGFDLQYAKENNININILRKIPSMYAVKSSGYVLGKFIISTLNVE